MEVIETESFIKSLKNLNSFKSKLLGVRSWIKHHTSKDFWKIVKKVFTSYPWDYSYLYQIEKAKIEEMANYLEKSNRFVGVEQVVRDMRICISLLSIMIGEKELFRYDGGMVHIPNGDGTYKVRPSKDFKYNCLVKVNTRNAARFVDDEVYRNYCIEHPHELYEVKARKLYFKIREERDMTWWD